MNIIIIDPSLAVQAGHPFGYDRAVAEAARLQGMNVRLCGALNANAVCRRENDFVPCFEKVVAKIMGGGRNPLVLWKVGRAIVTLYKQFCRTWRSGNGMNAEPNDILFVPTILLPDLVPFSLFIWRMRHELSLHNIRVVIMLRFDLKRGSHSSNFMTKVFGWIHQGCHYLMKKAMDSRLAYVTDTDLLQNDYEKLLQWPVSVCPIPVSKPSNSCSYSKSKFMRPDKALIITYLGGARLNKGFDLFVEMIEQLSKNAELWSRVRVIAHAYVIPGQQPVQDLDRMMPCVKRLNMLASRFAQVRVYNQVISDSEYQDILRSSDVTVVLYRPPIFRAQSSNILIEAVLNASVPIVAQHTWLYNELVKEGLSELGVDLNSEEQLSMILPWVIRNYNDLQMRLNPIREKWAKYHTANGVLECILRCASSRKGAAA